MQNQSLVQRPLALGRELAVRLQPLAALCTRLVLGITFFRTGLGKWQHFDDTVSFFTDLGIPAPAANAAFISSLELAGGILLILGLGTRLSAALLSATMIVALMTADRADFVAAISGSPDKGLTDVTPLPFLLMLGWLVAFGAGALSLDCLLFRRMGDAARAQERTARAPA